MIIDNLVENREQRKAQKYCRSNRTTGIFNITVQTPITRKLIVCKKNILEIQSTNEYKNDNVGMFDFVCVSSITFSIWQ